MKRFACLLALVVTFPAASQTLDRPDAFGHAFALSLYQFDSCGDPLAGRMFRRALAVRFAQCPFTAEARARFTAETRGHVARSRRFMENQIETAGGLPRQLEGMTTTCHAQQASESYRSYRSQLEAFNAGTLPAEAIIPGACDAADLTPATQP